MAISVDVVRIVVTGTPRPFSMDTGVATRPDKNGERVPIMVPVMRKGPDGRRVAVIKNGKPLMRPMTWKYRPAHLKTYQDHLRRAAEDAMAGRPLFEGAVLLTVRAYMPIPKSMRKADRLLAERELLPHILRPDLDNLHKAAKDALKGRVWRDDSQASMYGTPFKVYSPRPRLEIEVRAISTIADGLALADKDAAPFVRFVQESLL